MELAGGLRPEASTRRIQLTGGPQPIGVDLDRAHFAADAEANPPVYGGTTIQVPTRTPNSVRVVGEVQKPGEIELLDGDTWETLVDLAGGALPTGDPTSAYLSNDSARLLNKSTRLKPGDVLVVPVRADLLAERGLFVTGAVRHPGGFAYATDMTVNRLLDLAGGPNGLANSARMVIFRRPDRMEPGADTLPRIPISNLRAADGKLKPVALRPFDSVYVPVIIGVVRVSGQVQRPGFVPFEPGKLASYYIAVAGDYLSTANRVGVVVRNRVTGETISSSPDALVQDGDEVVVTPQGGARD
jgi:protein involved in polysaccharide export with SLBB domain